jgi:hypothetical protein
MVDYLSSQLQAPIPGQSLTTEPGARPWEKPARFTLPEEAMGYYLDKFADANRTAEMLDILESGFPVTNLIDGITMADDTLIAKAMATNTSKADELVKQVQTEENERVQQAVSGLMARETEAPEAPEALEAPETAEEEMPI